MKGRMWTDRKSRKKRRTNRVKWERGKIRERIRKANKWEIQRVRERGEGREREREEDDESKLCRKWEKKCGEEKESGWGRVRRDRIAEKWKEKDKSERDERWRKWWQKVYEETKSWKRDSERRKRNGGIQETEWDR